MQLVRDYDYRLAVLFHVAHDFEEALRLLRGQHRGGLVQYEDIRAAVKHLDYLERLLLGDGHIVDLLIGIDLEPVAPADIGHLAADILQIKAEALVKSEHDVLRRGKHVHELEMLMDHADVQIERILGGIYYDGLPFDLDMPLVGEIDAGEHVHQRRLAAAVLPEEREYLALIYAHVDMVVDRDGSEMLSYAYELDGGNAPLFGVSDRIRRRLGPLRNMLAQIVFQVLPLLLMRLVLPLSAAKNQIQLYLIFAVLST